MAISHNIMRWNLTWHTCSDNSIVWKMSFFVQHLPNRISYLTVRLNKPRPVGVVRVNWLCLETAPCYSYNWVIPITSRKEQHMSRFQKLSHVLWHCQYHIVWTPKYRLRVLKDRVSREVHNCINIFSGKLGCEIVDLNIQSDHIHIIVNVPPKVSISQLLGTVKGRTAIRVFKQFPYLKQKP